MINSKDKEVRERFDREVKPIIENPLYEYNFTEGHEKPKRCTAEDLDKVKAFINSELSLRTKEIVEMVRGYIKEHTGAYPFPTIQEGVAKEILSLIESKYNK